MKIYRKVNNGVDEFPYTTKQHHNTLVGEVETGGTFRVLYDNTSDGGWELYNSFERNLYDSDVVKDLCKERLAGLRTEWEDWTEEDDKKVEFWVMEHVVDEDGVEEYGDFISIE